MRKQLKFSTLMTRNFAGFTLAMLTCAGAQAATISTTLTVNATANISTSVSISGTASLTNGVGNGTFTSTLSVPNFSGPYTIALSGGGTITGIFTASVSLLTSSGTGTLTVTGGTGAYSGATGSFPNLSGTGTVSTTTGAVTITFGGAGTINTGGTVGPTPPTITAVWDAGSNTPNLALGSIFIVKGTSLCPSGTNFFNIPRPTVAPDGVKITFTPAAGGAGTDALLWYEYNPSGVCQLAGILPSTLPAGNYNVTVTNGTVSAPVATQVMRSKFSLFTQDSSGTGLAVSQNFISATRVDLNRLTSGSLNGTTISPAHPGQSMIAYGTGLGPLVGGDNAAAPVYDFSTHGVNVQAIVGGMTIPVAFAGLAGYAGEDQINFALPANVPTGCTVSFQLSVDGVLSSPTFIAIAPPNGTECVQPGFTAAQLKNFDNGGAFTVGSFSLGQLQESVPSYGTIKFNSASGAFTRYTGFQLSGAAQYSATTSTSGACTVIHTRVIGAATSAPISAGVGLDAGTVTLNGPSASNISNLAFKQDPTSNSYSLTLASEGLPVGGGTGTIVAGQYTITGAGGKDVNKFSSSITVGSPITITSGNGALPATVNRSAGLPLTWTGGNASDLVEIVGFSSTTTGTGASAISDSWEFVCTTTAGTGSFTVPSSVLLQLPASAVSTDGTGAGFLELASSVAPSTFTASLTAGGSIDSGTFLSFLGVAGAVTFQ